VHEAWVAEVVEAARLEDLRARLEPHGLAELYAGVLGEDLGRHAAERAEHRPAGVDDLHAGSTSERVCGWNYGCNVATAEHRVHSKQQPSHVPQTSLEQVHPQQLCCRGGAAPRSRGTWRTSRGRRRGRRCPSRSHRGTRP
jgi:hypothetical protein